MAQTFSYTTVDSQNFLWQSLHFESAKQLKMNNDIVLSRPDKGAGVVILNRSDYLSKKAAILGDTDKFLRLGDLSFDDTQRIENKIQKRFLELYKSKLKEIYEFIRPVGSQRPRMYGLPKIHKTGIPLRPILSICHSAKHSLAKWLVDVFDPVLDFYSVCCVILCVVLRTLLNSLPLFVDNPFVWSPNFWSLWMLSLFLQIFR